MSLIDIIKILLEPQKVVMAFGLVGVIGIIFAETGLFFGFFLPGDSLLFTAGFLASQNLLPLAPLLIGTFIASIIGDSIGYWFGKKTGPAIFYKEDSFFFRKKHVENARIFYEKHGKTTIILARFVPIIRTFAPIVAGVANMNYRIFISYNVIGGFLWTIGLTSAGYFLGRSIPSADAYLLPIVLLITLASFTPGIVHIWNERKKDRNVVQ
jgi:membrane-associated protein